MTPPPVTGFPDFHYVVEELHHADAAIFAVGRFVGTHEGSWRGLPATGRKVGFPMLALFPFGGEHMRGERIFFDLTTALRHLGVGWDPTTLWGQIATALNHPITIGRAVLHTMFGRR